MKSFRLFLAIALFPVMCTAQYVEAGIYAGMSRYQGDLTTSLFQTADFSLAYGGYARYYPNHLFSFKIHGYVMEISGHDSFAEPGNPTSRYYRGLSFRSDIYEVGIQGEYNITGFDVLSDELFSPYVFVGVSAFYFNPIAQLGDQFYELQPLGTEGQGMAEYPDRQKYDLFQFAVPIGIGIKWCVNDLVTLGVEFGNRFTFTDYLDDVSTTYPDLDLLRENNPVAADLSYRAFAEEGGNIPRNPKGAKRGNPDNRDWYMTGGITVGINLGGTY